MTVSERVTGGVPVRTAAEVAASIPADATVATSGFGSVGYPKAVPLALAADDRDLSLTVTSGGSVGGEIDTEMVEAGAIARRYPYQATPEARAAVNAGDIAFHDRHVSRMADEVELRQLADVDVAVVEAVAAGPDWLVPSTSIGPTPAYVAAADRVIVEVNDAQPLGLQHLHDVYRRSPPPDRGPVPLSDAGERIGSPRIDVPSGVEAVVRSDRPDTAYTFRDPTDADRAVGRHLVAFLDDEVDRNPALAEAVHLQFGVGSVGNALMAALSSFDPGGCELVYYGEVIQDGLLDLLESGRFDAASATSLALTHAGQERLFADVAGYAEHVVLRPADLSNDPGLIDRFGVVAVNSALEVDLYGHANSTHVDGSRLINGIGGSNDFTRHGLVSVVALPSTADDGDVSRIVPMVPHVDHTEHDVDVVVTDQGIADLRGRSPTERATALVEQCAHPRHRADLRAYRATAEGSGHVPHDLDAAFDWRSE